MNLSKTPWVDRSMKTVWERVVAASPKPSWAPRLLPGKKFSLEEYGCGHYGCVFPTSDPEVVCKLTSDPTEAFFVAAAMSIGTFPEGIVRYYGIYQIPGATHRGRPLFVLWREAATEVGKVLQRTFWGDPADLSASELYEFRAKESLKRRLDLFKNNAHWVRERLKRSRDPFTTVEEASRLKDWAWEWRTASEQERRAAPYPSGVVRSIAIDLVALDQIAVEMENEYLADQIGGAFKFYLDEGLLLADVHAGNVGLVKGRVGKTPVITDPGHAVPLDRKWANVQVPELP